MGRTQRVSIFAAAGLLVASAALANHIPGHDDCDPTFPVPLPDQDTYSGGGSIIFLTAIGPAGETQILGTKITVTFVSDGATPARDLLIVIQPQVNQGNPELEVTGADLGFGSDPGTYHGSIETDFFNGEVWEFSGFGSSIVDLEIGAVNGGVEGTAYFVDSFVTFDLGLRVEGTAPTVLHYKSPFDVATGSLSNLQATGEFGDAACLGTFQTSSGTDNLSEPDSGEGRYYLARGLNFCAQQGYGRSSITPDPRRPLNNSPPCP